MTTGVDNIVRISEQFDENMHLNEDPLRWVGVFEFISKNKLIVFHNSGGVLYQYSLDL